MAERHYNANSTAAHLPLVVLAEIFLYSKLSSELDPDPYLFDYTPWILSSVCRSWRDVAIHTSALWTKIGINLDEPDRFERAGFMELWLARSGVLPLDVHLDREARLLDNKLTSLEFIASHMHRIRSLKVVANTSHTAESILAYFEASAPLLERFSAVNLNEKPRGRYPREIPTRYYFEEFQGRAHLTPKLQSLEALGYFRPFRYSSWLPQTGVGSSHGPSHPDRGYVSTSQGRSS